MEIVSYKAAPWPHNALVVFWKREPILYVDPTFSRFFVESKGIYEILAIPIYSLERTQLQNAFYKFGIAATIVKVNLGSAWQPPGFNTAQVRHLVSKDEKMIQVIKLIKDLLLTLGVSLEWVGEFNLEADEDLKK